MYQNDLKNSQKCSEEVVSKAMGIESFAFDLDIQTIKSDMDIEPASSSNLCIFTIQKCTEFVTIISCNPTECVCGGAGQGCSESTCSDCHSYCGSGCRQV